MRPPLASIALLTSFVAPRALAQCQYDVVTLPGLCGPADSHSVTDISDDDIVVGFYTVCGGTAWRAWRWSPAAGSEQLPLPAGVAIGNCLAYRVADDGTVTGRAEVSEGYGLIVWRTDGTVEIHLPVGSGSYVNSAVLRQDGTILGEVENGPGGFNPYAWFDGALAPLPDGLASAHGGIYDVAPSGLATGQRFLESWVIDARPFVWNGEDQVLVLPPPDGYPVAWGTRIDDLGRIAGDAVVPSPTSWQAFYWESGQFTLLGWLPGDTQSRVKDSNDLGQVVGQSKPVAASSGKPFLWQHGTMVSLASLGTFPPNDAPYVVGGINNQGVIAVKGYIHTYLLRPQGVVAADVDINCRVDADDLALVLASWGPADSSPVRRADVNGDGIVDGYDLAEVLGAWSPPAESPRDSPKRRGGGERKPPPKPTST